MTRRTSINFDTFFPIGKGGETYKQGWGIGYDIETGGHVFQLMVTNARGHLKVSILRMPVVHLKI